MAKKKCVKGYGCGNACIARTRTCKSNTDGEGKKITETFQQYIARLGEKSNTGGLDELLNPAVSTGDITSSLSTKTLDGLIKQLQKAIGDSQEIAGDPPTSPSLEELKPKKPAGQISFFDLENGVLKQTEKRKNAISQAQEQLEISKEAGIKEIIKEDESNLNDVIHGSSKQARALVEQKYKQVFNGELGVEDQEAAKQYGINLDNFKSAVLDFTSIGYKDMRNLLVNEGEGVPNYNERAEKVDILRDAIDKLPSYEDTIYRGIRKSLTTEASTKFFEDLLTLEPGDEWHQDSLSSYSGKESIATGFAGAVGKALEGAEEKSVILRINPGKNTRGVSVAPLSKFPGEREIIVKDGKYKVTNVSFNDKGYRYIDLEEI